MMTYVERFWASTRMEFFFLSLQVYEWIGISTVEYIKGQGKLSFFLVLKKPKGITDVRAVKD